MNTIPGCLKQQSPIFHFFKKIIFKLGYSVFFWIFLFGFIVSLPLFFGKIDQDFFSYYYIGKGITKGLSLYRDFADNKGPVLYLFFAFLYKIFKDNYLRALFFSNWVLDTVSIFLITKLLSKWVKYDFVPLTFKKLLLLFFVVFYYKSFSIGIMMGGTYPENLAFLLLTTSLLFYENKKIFISGLFFGLAVFCRQTVVFFSLFYLYKLISGKKSTKDFIRFGLGGLLVGLSFLAYFAFKGEWGYFIQNTVISSLNYAITAKNLFYKIVFLRSLIETRIILSLVFSLVVVVKTKVAKNEKFFLIFLFLSSLLSTFVGGIFYFHHFLQFSFVFLSCLVIAVKEKSRIYTYFLSLVVLFVLVGNLTLLSSGKNANERIVYQKLNEFLNSNPKSYLQVTSYFPQLYFETGKQSPDRYFIPIFLSDYYSKNAKDDREVHLRGIKDRTDETYFVKVDTGGYDTFGEEYLKNIKDILKLKIVYQIKEKGMEVTVYAAENEKH